MSRIKLLLDVVQDMRNLADSLQAVADVLEQGGSQKPDEKPAEPAEPGDPPAPPKPEISLEDVRTLLGQKSRAGYTDAVRALLQQFGATKLSEIKPEDYAALMKAAEELDHGA